MPELPEVETVRLSLAEKVLGSGIQWVRVHHPDAVLAPAPDLWPELLTGAALTGTGRRGKYLFLACRHSHLDDDLVLLVHLRMTGRLLVVPEGEPLVKHTHVQMGLSDGRELRFVDPRRFGCLALLPMTQLGPVATAAGLAPAAAGEGGHGAGGALDWAAVREALPPGLWNLGPEPLSDGFTTAYLAQGLAGRKAPIKGLLLDQRLVAGLGNIYVDEALFRAGIHPGRPGGELRDDEIRRLHKAIGQVLQEGIAWRGTTFSDFVDSESRPGGMGRRLQVFRRQGEPCPKCGTNIEKTRLAGRGTHFCPRCQA